MALNFNATASHFYLGLGAYQQLNYTEAEAHFSKVADSDLPPYSVIAKYYLGICYFKLNNGAQGIQELVEVKSLTAGAENGDVTKTIADATEKMLAPFSLGQWFGNALLQSQYDSNVQQLPTGASNPTGGTNPGTLKMNLSGGGGYMSAPLKPIQLVAAYRASYNYNFNSSTKGFEYFTNNLSLFANYHALARTSAGLKLDTNFVFQNSLVDPTNTQGAYQYQKYNFTAGFGPYFRHQLTREWKLEAELGVRTQTFYSDPNLSGMKYNSRISFRSDQRNAYFNPGTSLVYENNRANGDDYYSSSYGLGILNTMTFPASVIFSQALDVLFTQYSKSILSRSDQNYSFKLGASKVLNAKVSMMADLSYTTNDSNISQSYSYHQWVTSLGMGYTF